MKNTTQASKKNYIILLLVIFSCFFIFGISENIKGPALPLIQSELGLDYSQIGILLSLNTLGYLLACSFTNAINKRIGSKALLTIACSSMAIAGIAMYFSHSFASISASTFLLYVGNGMIEIGMAIVAARIFTRNVATMMNLSHFFYGFASIIAPIVASALISKAGWNGMYFLALAVCWIPLIFIFMSKFPRQEELAVKRTSKKVLLKDKKLWLLTLILSLSVITELSVGSWLCNYLETAFHWSNANASVMLAIFFITFTLSRAFLGPAIDKIGCLKSIGILSLFAAACVLIGVVTNEFGAWLLALAGFGVAPIYPTVMALIAKVYPNDSDDVVSISVTLMGIAGILGTLIIGYINDFFTYLFNSTIGLKSGFVTLGLFSLISALLVCRMLKKYPDAETTPE